MSAQLIVFLVSMLPIFELRGSIPLGLTAYHLPPLDAYVWSVLGNMAPVALLLVCLGPISAWLSHRFYYCNRFFAWLFERTRRKHDEKFAIWGSLALVLFVAIPLPMTGGWTGAVAAFVFGISPKKAFPLIFLGVLIAGVVVTLASLGIIHTI